MLIGLKKMGRSGDIENTEEQGENSNFNFNLKEVLDEALDKLPKTQKALVLLRDYEGHNYNEIAEITGLGESQVKVYIFHNA